MNADSFVDQLRVMGALEDGAATDRVLDAFRSVPREAFAGPGPWQLRSPHEGFSLPVRETPDAKPKWLYNSVLIVLDEEKGINIGDPVFWARRLVHTDVRPGARVLQVGTGVGYYTAILSHLVGAKGSIVSYEIEPDLSERARANLRGWSNVELRQGDATTDLEPEDRFDLIVAFAGITHVPRLWSSHLLSKGQLLVPLTGENWWGAMILADKTDRGFDAVTLGGVGVYPCAGARDDTAAKRISGFFSDPSRLVGARLRLEAQSDAQRIDLVV